MDETIKFSTRALEFYLLTDFARGKDFRPKFHGKQLTEKDEMDFQGGPALRDDFAEYMDDNTFDLVIPYEHFQRLYDSMAREVIMSLRDTRMEYLHSLWSWWSFERRQGVTVEAYAEKRGITERTVYRQKIQLLYHIRREVSKPPQAEVIIFPASYRPVAVNG